MSLVPFGPSESASLRRHLDLCLHLLQTMEWLLDAYVVDFFTMDHWRSLPPEWREVLEAMAPEEMAEWIDMKWRERQPTAPKRMSKPMPLALMALR